MRADSLFQFYFLNTVEGAISCSAREPHEQRPLQTNTRLEGRFSTTPSSPLCRLGLCTSHWPAFSSAFPELESRDDLLYNAFPAHGATPLGFLSRSTLIRVLFVRGVFRSLVFSPLLRWQYDSSTIWCYCIGSAIPDFEGLETYV